MRKDLLGRYARLGIVLAAFTLVVGIIGAPVLPQFWPPSVIGAQAKGCSSVERRVANGISTVPFDFTIQALRAPLRGAFRETR